MTILHFVRHGQSTWNAERRVQGQSDPPLSPLGETEAANLGERLAGKQFDRVFSSDLLRTRQTTEGVLQGAIDDVEYREALREIHLGPWEAVMLEDATANYPEQAHNFRHAPDKFDLEGAETFHVLQKRAHEAINAIREECAGLEVLIVSHGAFIKSLLTDYADRPLANLWHPPEMHNCAHSIVQWDKGASVSENPKIVQFADLTDW